MVLQSVIYQIDICKYSKLYYRNAELLVQDEKTAIIPSNSKVSFFSYMNCFDTDAWSKYTDLKEANLRLWVRGKGKLYLKYRYNNEDRIACAIEFSSNSSDNYQEICQDIDIVNQKGLCYFEIESDSEVILYDARFETEQVRDKGKVHIGLNICTYHRNDNVIRNLNKIKSSQFFDKKSDVYNKLSVVIVDNGSELQTIDDGNIRLIHNENNGGSGGFTRGLEELRQEKSTVTHIVFMDDDVEFTNESLYRLYAMLSFLKDEYKQEPVAGRMFRMDDRNVQYTAAEIWNKGNIKHIGFNLDMTDEDNLPFMNKNEGAEYGGWWFCCYPMNFAEKNDPLPFFLHCDDVEYGLRHCGMPIILNGIQVWHETYEYRQSLTTTYYDMKNSMIVNAIYGLVSYEEMLHQWKKLITEAHINNDFMQERMLILGMLSFLKGKTFFMKRDVALEHIKISKKKIKCRYINSILWRYAVKKFCKVKGRLGYEA